MQIDSQNPVMFCRYCDYILDGLPSNRCPECGRNFDPDDPRTYRLRTPQSLRRRLVLAPLILLPIVAIATWVLRPTAAPPKAAQIPPARFWLTPGPRPDGSVVTIRPDGTIVIEHGSPQMRYNLRRYDKPGKWAPADIVEPRH
jgi:hypothetical protein